MRMTKRFARAQNDDPSSVSFAKQRTTTPASLKPPCNSVIIDRYNYRNIKGCVGAIKLRFHQVKNSNFIGF